eukprot:gnl/TRDRNA2_/TRDRNA2_155782_c2_seq2.p1 gnl/TRDRNA2_/TRDRNA2_155782_c2~~gnl/TRDRNA2_/TRDRNA2_155782_c2_seq2.p1  ORF type:complete len:121 (-),score=9.93 gnl/TRDRNA2_/TRDRNA2_155782_c2_seq2:41-403(-)
MPAIRAIRRSLKSHVSVRERGFRWGNFETGPQCKERMVSTIEARAAEHPGTTLVFVSHGGPSAKGFAGLARREVPDGSGGMTALSLLRRPSNAEGGTWEALVANDARHADEHHVGVRTLI